MYADLDFESIRNLDDVLSGQQVVLALMTDEEWDQKVPNAWLASSKGHPFWMFCMQQIIKAAGSCAATNTDRCAQMPCSFFYSCQTLFIGSTGGALPHCLHQRLLSLITILVLCGEFTGEF